MEATVTACTKVKEWNGKPIYSVELSDGTKGNSFGSEIPVGTAKTSLKITPKEGYPDDIKLNKPNGFAGVKREANNAAFAMSYAKDLVVAGKVEMKDLIASADKIYNWIEGKKK